VVSGHQSEISNQPLPVSKTGAPRVSPPICEERRNAWSFTMKLDPKPASDRGSRTNDARLPHEKK
jgi:hypothetical protein